MNTGVERTWASRLQERHHEEKGAHCPPRSNAMKRWHPPSTQCSFIFTTFTCEVISKHKGLKDGFRFLFCHPSSVSSAFWVVSLAVPISLWRRRVRVPRGVPTVSPSAVHITSKWCVVKHMKLPHTIECASPATQARDMNTCFSVKNIHTYSINSFQLIQPRRNCLRFFPRICGITSFL